MDASYRIRDELDRQYETYIPGLAGVNNITEEAGMAVEGWSPTADRGLFIMCRASSKRSADNPETIRCIS